MSAFIYKKNNLMFSQTVLNKNTSLPFFVVVCFVFCFVICYTFCLLLCVERLCLYVLPFGSVLIPEALTVILTFYVAAEIFMLINSEKAGLQGFDDWSFLSKSGFGLCIHAYELLLPLTGGQMNNSCYDSPQHRRHTERKRPRSDL